VKPRTGGVINRREVQVRNGFIIKKNHRGWEGDKRRSRKKRGAVRENLWHFQRHGRHSRKRWGARKKVGSGDRVTEKNQGKEA